MKGKEVQEPNELEKRLNGLTIDQVEQRIETSLKQVVEGRKAVIMDIFALERTGRYKENPRYKNATFREYLKDRWRLPESAYREERIAFTNQIEYVERHGLDRTIRVNKLCGVLEAPKVFKAIEKEEIKRKKTLPWNRVSEIVGQFAKKTKSPPKTEHMTPAEYQKIIDSQRDEISSLREAYNELEEQVDRLKATVEKYKEAAREVFEFEPA